MIEFLIEYAMFVAKGLTLVILLLLAFGGIVLIFMRSKAAHDEHLEVTRLNEKYQHMSMQLKSIALSDKAFKKELKAQKNQHKKAQKESEEQPRKKVFVLDFDGDVHASDVASIRESITAILSLATSSDEVVLLLESPGGAVHDYGLAASQLQRIVNKGVKLTVAVDKVAASGGYMMACVADKIIAAPFAIIGSIGVIGQMPNFNKLLKKFDIDYEQMTAGEYKRTLSVLGENTEKGRRKAQQEIEDTHLLFKEFVLENRSNLDIESIATGEHWYGKRALALNLVDQLCTSDDYLCAAAEQADLFMVEYVLHKKGLVERLFSFTGSMLGMV